VPDDGGNSDVNGVDAMLERLSPAGRAVVLAFAYGARRLPSERDAVAMVVMHRLVLRSEWTERELAQASGMSRKGLRSVCDEFASLMRRCIQREGLRAADIFAPRVDDPEEPA